MLGVGAVLSSALANQSAAKPVRLAFIGVGARGSGLLKVALSLEGVEVPAVCDINEAALKRALDSVQKTRGQRPAGFSDGPTDYRRMLQRDDFDAVLVATPMQLHAGMCVDALGAGKHVLSEVAAAMKLDDCWALVRAAEETDRIYMMAENCCYYRQNLAVRKMVREGVFGTPTYAECGYIHEARARLFKPDGTLTWRGEMWRDFAGNVYPTHPLGPVCQWFGINRGDRLESLTAFTTTPSSLREFAVNKFGADSAAANIPFQAGDSTVALIRTAKGAVVNLRFDCTSPRPVASTTYFTLQGTRASYEDRDQNRRICFDGRNPRSGWEPFDAHIGPYEHPLWQKDADKARETGHNGADYFTISEFGETVRHARPSPIDVYDAAAWSCVIALTDASIRAGGAPQAVPDFTRGAWEKRTADI